MVKGMGFRLGVITVSSQEEKSPLAEALRLCFLDGPLVPPLLCSFLPFLPNLKAPVVTTIFDSQKGNNS